MHVHVQFLYVCDFLFLLFYGRLSAWRMDV